MKRGKLIVIEGLEGAGKSTAIAVCESYFQTHAIPYQVTREPGGTPVAEKIRDIFKTTEHEEVLDPRTELLLLYAARVQHIQSRIQPALERGEVVICDRFELSTYAYQAGGRGIPHHFIETLSFYCVGEFKPDLTIYMDIKPHVGLERARGRGALDRMEQESLDFFIRVQQAYLNEIKKISNVVKIDASFPLEHVKTELIEVLQGYFNE